MGWKSIKSAPRDGTAIELRAEDDDAIVNSPHIMKWNPKARNNLVGNVVGLWVSLDETYTWDESRGFGPTHWRALN